MMTFELIFILHVPISQWLFTPQHGGGSPVGTLTEYRFSTGNNSNTFNSKDGANWDSLGARDGD